MAISPEPLRSRDIRICGHRLSIRTDLDEAALNRIIAFAEERLAKQGLHSASEDVKRLLLPFLVLCGEFIEQKEKLEQVEERLFELIQKFDLAFPRENSDIEIG